MPMPSIAGSYARTAWGRLGQRAVSTLAAGAHARSPRRARLHTAASHASSQAGREQRLSGGIALATARDRVSERETDIPVVEEHVRVGAREVEHGRVAVQKRVHEELHQIDAPAFHDEVEIEHVAVDRFVDSPPETRREGDTLIIPCLEEVVVVETRLRLREEVRIRRVRRETREQRVVTVRREEVEVERQPPEGGGDRPPPPHGTQSR